jgi:hypothetical protein
MAVRSHSPKAASKKSTGASTGMKVSKTIKGALKAVKTVKSAAAKVIASKAAPKSIATKGATKGAEKGAAKIAAKGGAKAPAKAGAKVLVAKPDTKAIPPVAQSRKAARVGKAGQSKAASSAAAAVERVTERLMGRASAEHSFESVCREVACEGLGTSAGYCRLHYIKNWKKIKRKEVILKEGKLNQYIEELVGKYPEKYIEAIRLDLANDKEFAKVIVDLDLDENDDDFEAEGSADSDVGIDSLKREFDEDADAF